MTPAEAALLAGGGLVAGVVNTLAGESERTDQLRDGFEIRRAAVERRIPCFTSLDTARVVAECLASGAMAYDVRTVQQYWSFDPGVAGGEGAVDQQRGTVGDVSQVGRG